MDENLVAALAARKAGTGAPIVAVAPGGLSDAIEARSPDRPILVGGDTNMAPQEAALSLLLERSGLLDACTSLECPGRDMIDRVLYRSASTLAIEPTSWTIDDRFRDERGEPLSDHPAIAVTFRWTSPRR